MVSGTDRRLEGTTQRITLERHYQATPAEVWELWTTREGIEEWWGPDGFAVTVQRLEIRVGGVIEYEMRATAAPQMAFLQKAGMPLSTQHRATFTEVVSNERLAFSMLADFIPGVAPYPVLTTVEIFPTATGVRMLVTIDPMHDAHWTDLSVRGWESELGRLERSLRKRSGWRPQLATSRRLSRKKLVSAMGSCPSTRRT